MLRLAGAAVLAAAAVAPAAAYEAVPVPDAGALAGVVRFTGAAPRPPVVAVRRPGDACAEEPAAEALVLGAERGVRGGVVLVEGVARGKPPAGEAVLETQRCAFVPHVAALMAGERARVKNGDGVVHNPRGVLGRATVFDVAAPGREQTVDITRRLARPGVVRVVCDLHPGMAAWIVVHDSPYVAVTDERGAFRIDGLPPATYRVTLWHEGYRARGVNRDGRPQYDPPRTLSRDVTIVPGATATVDFELK